MSMLISALTVFVFVAAYFFIGLFASRHVKSTNDYFLAGRSLGIWSVTFTLIATQLGGGMLLGTSEESYLYGLYGVFYTLSMVIGFMLLAFGFASVLRKLNVATTAELFETRYHSLPLRKFASVLSILTLSGLLIGQIVASRSVIDGLTGNSELAFLVVWLLIIGYTVAGGLYAVVLTDIFQVLFIIALFGAIFVYCLLYQPAGATSIPALLDIQQLHFSVKSILDPRFLGILLMPALFSLIEQDLAQRFFAARSRRIATLSALLAAIFIISFSIIPVYFGMQARLAGIYVPAKDALLAYLGLITNDFVILLAACGLMAAITSTADSLLCAISSNVAQDFNLSSAMRRLGIRNQLIQSQVITLIIGCIGIAASYLMPLGVIDILEGSYALSVNALFIPLIFAYFSKNVHRNAAIAAILAGLTTSALMPLWQTNFPKTLVPLAAALIAYGIGHWHSRKG